MRTFPAQYLETVSRPESVDLVNICSSSSLEWYRTITTSTLSCRCKYQVEDYIYKISSLYLMDLIEEWNVYVEASLINKMRRVKLIHTTAFYSITDGGRIWMIGFRWQKHWSAGKFQSIINQLANCCNAILTDFHSVICSHRLQRQPCQDMRRLWCLFQLQGWLLSPKY